MDVRSISLGNTVRADETALPEALRPLGLEPVGAGQFRVLGIHLYDASYWTDENTRALLITYRKSIRSEMLTSTMVSEWERLGTAPAHQLRDWADRVRGIWPNVRNGSSLIAVVSRGQTEFFDGSGSLLGKVADPRFGPAFLDIWLHPKTRARGLRTALLGEDLVRC